MANFEQSAKTAKAAIDDLDAGKAPGTKHVFVLMDESGSMGGLEEAVTTGCNEFIHSFLDDPEAKLWLAWFDKSPGEEQVRMPVKGLAAKDVAPLTPADYTPRGMTPLNDAIANAVTTLDAAAGPDEVVFLAIITDGNENASETSTRTIKKLLTKREEAGWGIVFIGANQNAQATAAEFGMGKHGQAFNFAADKISVALTMRNASYLAKTRAMHAAGKSGLDEYDLAAEKLFRDKQGRIDR